MSNLPLPGPGIVDPHSSTLNNAYNKIIKSTNDVAQDHIDLAETITTQVVEVLKVLERKNEDLKKKVGTLLSWMADITSFWSASKFNSFRNF